MLPVLVTGQERHVVQTWLCYSRSMSHQKDKFVKGALIKRYFNLTNPGEQNKRVLLGWDKETEKEKLVGCCKIRFY